MLTVSNLLHALYIVLTSGVGKNGSTVAVSNYSGQWNLSTAGLRRVARLSLQWPSRMERNVFRILTLFKTSEGGEGEVWREIGEGGRGREIKIEKGYGRE